MNRERWKREKDRQKLALKLCEEAGEVAKAVLGYTENPSVSRRAATLEELNHVRFIADRLTEVMDGSERR